MNDSKMKTNIDPHKIKTAFTRMIAAASGPTESTRIRILTGRIPPACKDSDGFEKLHITLDRVDRIVTEVGIAMHWKTEWIGAFRPARTASGQAPQCRNFGAVEAETVRRSPLRL